MLRICVWSSCAIGLAVSVFASENAGLPNPSAGAISGISSGNNVPPHTRLGRSEESERSDNLAHLGRSASSSRGFDSDAAASETPLRSMSPPPPAQIEPGSDEAQGVAQKAGIVPQQYPKLFKAAHSKYWLGFLSSSNLRMARLRFMRSLITYELKIYNKGPTSKKLDQDRYIAELTKDAHSVRKYEESFESEQMVAQLRRIASEAKWARDYHGVSRSSDDDDKLDSWPQKLETDITATRQAGSLPYQYKTAIKMRLPLVDPAVVPETQSEEHWHPDAVAARICSSVERKPLWCTIYRKRLASASKSRPDTKGPGPSSAESPDGSGQPRKSAWIAKAQAWMNRRS